jgi:hypothetical protein
MVLESNGHDTAQSYQETPPSHHLWCQTVAVMMLESNGYGTVQPYQGTPPSHHLCYSAVAMVLQWCCHGVTVVLHLRHPPAQTAAPVTAYAP